MACSRDGPEGVKRTYVQDLIEEDGESVWKVLGVSNGGLYISGSVFDIMRGFNLSLNYFGLIGRRTRCLLVLNMLLEQRRRNMEERQRTRQETSLRRWRERAD